MKNEDELTLSEQKTIVTILAFQALGKSMAKHLKTQHTGRSRGIIKKKWKKILLKVDASMLVLTRAEDPDTQKKAYSLFSLYLDLYTDIIDGSAVKSGRSVLKKIKELGAIPSLKSGFLDEIDRTVAVKVRKKGEETEKKSAAVYEEPPHIAPEIRERLVRYFKKELKRHEPIVMVDTRLQLRVDNLIRRHVDRSIDVSLSNGHKAMQNGYINNTSEALSKYVEEECVYSIDWKIKNEVLLNELVMG